VLGDNLAALSDIILTEAKPVLKIDVLAKRLAGQSDLSSQSLAKRLNLTIEKLNQMNYHARWEAGSEGPRIIFTHCPYAAIIEKHPELCQMDEALIRERIGQAAVQIFKTGKEGSTICVFVVGR
jgi:predicted ArsR family transcriptional regulator